MRAGALSGSLYHSFGSKEALAVAVLDEWGARRIVELADEAEDRWSDPLARVLGLVELYRRRVANGDWPPAARQRLAAELRTLRPELSAAGRRDGERLAARIRDWLDLAGPRLPADTDRGALARFVLTVAEGATLAAHAEGSLASFDEAVDQLRVHFELLQAAARMGRVSAPPEPADAVAAPTAAGDAAGWRSW